MTNTQRLTGMGAKIGRLLVNGIAECAHRAEGRCLHRRLLQLRELAGVPESASALRVCDVAVWMGHQGQGHACPR
ncbi:DUF6308 family protein [Streptomyces sp. NPDC060085]|uniref:DUF6308 family protein n=1 Tax=Streptomyces sp. NPDC060085 TaxID=3347054 RepID=UPI00364693D1